MKGSLVLVVAVCVFFLYTSASPTISQTFQAKVTITISHHSRGNDTGSGMWASDEKAQSALENYAFTKGAFDSFVLDRYDLGKLYRIYSANASRCDQFTVSEQMPNTWGWLVDARFIGKETFDSKSVDVWEHTLGYATRRLAVWSADTTTPVWMSTRGTEQDSNMQFVSFSTVSPATSVFAVPSVCTTLSGRPPVQPDACISQATIMANAEIWVKNKVPYNINGRYMNYREDCSGYVSFTWQSGAPGLDTMEFHTMAHPITRAELLPGDCMLNAGDHVCLFGGWTDAAKDHYNAYEETQPCSDNPNYCGTRIDNTVYPYYLDPSKFLPYRFNNRCA